MSDAASRFVAATIVLALAGCAAVRQEDLDAWRGMPVEALDTHSLFLTMPMVRTMTAGGIEIRDYSNGVRTASCETSGSAVASGAWINSGAFSSCRSGWIGCHNLFYIRDGHVLEYAPTGRCKTDASVRPQARYQALMGGK
jgi:hypothetical protein